MKCCIIPLHLCPTHSFFQASPLGKVEKIYSLYTLASVHPFFFSPHLPIHHAPSTTPLTVVSSAPHPPKVKCLRETLLTALTPYTDTIICANTNALYNSGFFANVFKLSIFNNFQVHFFFLSNYPLRILGHHKKCNVCASVWNRAPSPHKIQNFRTPFSSSFA